MSIQSILADAAHREFSNDRRPEAPQVSIITPSWDELYQTMDRAIDAFTSNTYKFRFNHGEKSAYGDELKNLKDLLQKDLQPKIQHLQAEFDFRCEPKAHGGGHLKAKIAGIISLDIWSQFYDTFSNGGNVRAYVGQNRYAVSEKIRSLRFDP